MKIMISVLSALTIALTAIPACAYAKQSDDPELYELAYSLGADKDYLNIHNYCYVPTLNDNNIIGYSYESILPVDEYTNLPSGEAVYSDSSFGISVIEVLVHNGVFSADKVESGAESLNKINDTKEIRKLITDYQSLLNKTEFNFAANYAFKNKSANDKIAELISIAEKAVKEKKYFLIMYGSYNRTPSAHEKNAGMDKEGTSRVSKAHSAVGIGITEGSWSFDNRNFDKCVLTLDSFSVNENSGAFSDKTCIYINSSTNDYYIPAYSDLVESDLHIVAIDDDTLLNFGGAISPTESFDTDISDIINITMTNKNTDCKYEIKALKDDETAILKNENEFMDYYHNPYNGNLFIKADKVSINRKSKSNVDRITLSKYDSYAEIELKQSDSTIDFDGKSYRLTREEDKNDQVLDYNISINTKYGAWDFYGQTLSSVCFSLNENGIVVEGDENIISTELVISNNKASNIFATEKVFIQEQSNGEITFLIDKDNDNVFETQAQKGDVNCDGYINAVDASLILADYSNASTDQKTFLNTQLADYNGDGYVDAVDASAVLAEYARLSTKI